MIWLFFTESFTVSHFGWKNNNKITISAEKEKHEMKIVSKLEEKKKGEKESCYMVELQRLGKNKTRFLS
jgi:hypothetical protein